MSDRGSFCTEYIYCPKCFNAVKNVILKDQGDCFYCKIRNQRNDFTHYSIKSVFDTKNIQIVCGFISSTASGFEILAFKESIIPELKKVICHEVRIVVIAENGERIFSIKPKGNILIKSV